MKCYIVTWNCSVIGAFSCITDAARCAKALAGSTVTPVQLNALSEIGQALAASNPNLAAT